VPLLLLLLAADIAVAVARSGNGDDNGGEQAAAPTTVTTAVVSSATTTTTTAAPRPTPNATGVTAGGSGSASSRPLATTGGPAWTAPLGGALLAGGLATRQRARRHR
jgi:hypothetical protein